MNDPNTARMMRFFQFGHLPQGPLRQASERCHQLAAEMRDTLPGGPEKTAGLRKLLEAKDCFVRAALPEKPPAITPSNTGA